MSVIKDPLGWQLTLLWWKHRLGRIGCWLIGHRWSDPYGFGPAAYLLDCGRCGAVGSALTGRVISK